MFGSHSSSRKRKKTLVQVTRTEKKKICEIQRHNPKWTQDKIVEVASTDAPFASKNVLQGMGMSDEECNVEDFIFLPGADQVIVIMTLHWVKNAKATLPLRRGSL